MYSHVVRVLIFRHLAVSHARKHRVKVSRAGDKIRPYCVMHPSSKTDGRKDRQEGTVLGMAGISATKPTMVGIAKRQSVTPFRTHV